MMNKDRSKTFSPATVFLLIFTMIIVSTYIIITQYVILRKVNVLLEQQDAAKHANSKQNLTAAIEDHFAKQKQQAIDAKFSEYKLAQNVVNNNLHIYGSTKARFTLVTFSDLECPYCRKFHDVPKQIVDAYPDVINAQFVHFPLSSHNPAAMTEAIASECVAKSAGNKAFWVYINDVFQTSKGNGGGVADLRSLIADLGVDMQAFDKCMQTENLNELIGTQLQLGQQLNVSAVPTSVLIDNATKKDILLPGVRPAEAILAVVDKILAEEKEANHGK